ncbi:MAG: bifunctional hydroxymethylpyrimidine kinase/phosphomethylpyrimidine kinase, partial [Pseudomonadota bacterium]
DQIATVFADIRVDAVKIGMIATAGIATAVADALAEHDMPIVLDPVMIAKGGAPLLQPDAIETLRTRLLPRAKVLTPNLPEAAHLLGTDPAQTPEGMEAQAQALRALGPQAVLLKGGHLSGTESPDCLTTASGTHWLKAPRTDTPNTHGTGCTLSAALAAQLARGEALTDAATAAKAYVAQAIAAADTLSVGHGHGPTHHFATLWSTQT